MKLKTNNAAKKSVNGNKNKSPNKQAKGVEVRKEKSKIIVKPTVLKKEAEKTKVEAPTNPAKVLQQELWNKAIENISNISDLSNDESSIVKLLADYKRKSSIPQKNIKLKNFITKGFSQYKNTSDDVLDGIYSKILNEFKTLGGNAENIVDNKSLRSSKKADAKTNKLKSKKEDSIDEEVDIEDEENDDGDDDDEDDEAEGITFGDSDDDIDNDEEESEEEKPKPKGKGNKANNKNGKSPNKGKNGSKFKGGKVQKNKKFGKKK